MSEISMSEFGRVFGLFQEVHPEAPYMEAHFSARRGRDMRVGIQYRGGCYINSYEHSAEEVYQMMLGDIAAAQRRGGATAQKDMV